MKTVLIVFAIQGVFGAFDTLYYHEWRARLPLRGAAVAAELRLHAARDFAYAAIFALLPLYELHGVWGLLMAAILLFEIVVTFTDFAIEARVRKPFGDVYPGERITHGAMAILYGAACANLLPLLWRWIAAPDALLRRGDIPRPLVLLLLLFSGGVFLSGLRDLYASTGRRGAGWPWGETASP